MEDEYGFTIVSPVLIYPTLEREKEIDLSILDELMQTYGPYISFRIEKVGDCFDLYITDDNWGIGYERFYTTLTPH